MKEKSKIETVDVDFDGFDLTKIGGVGSVELEIAVLVETLFLLWDGHVVEYVYLGGNFAVVRDKLYFSDVYDSIELDGDLLRIGAEAFGLPSF